MPRKRNSLKHDVFVAATKDVTNNTSRTSYKRSATRFAKWAKENNIKKISDITEEVLQKYHDDLKNDPKAYTAATIHTYLAPIAKAAGINLNRIKKQKRTSNKIVRGRIRESNEQGKKQMQYILPNDIELVRQTFAGIGENETSTFTVINFQVGRRSSEIEKRITKYIRTTA